jgi:hypothetical protein
MESAAITTRRVKGIEERQKPHLGCQHSFPLSRRGEKSGKGSNHTFAQFGIDAMNAIPINHHLSTVSARTNAATIFLGD